MNAYPLSWPEGWPRTKAGYHQRGRFSKKQERSAGGYQWKEHLTVSDSLARVLEELQRMGVDRQDVIVSTNVRTRLDGLPRSGEKEPEDSGAAVYWEERSGARRVLAIDQYVRIADNLAAIAATLDALRAVERHGGARILERAFTGFTSLPAPGQTAKRTWRQVLGFTAAEIVNADGIRARYRALASAHHPDKGGTDASMAELNAAFEQAKKEVAL